jgi:protease II
MKPLNYLFCDTVMYLTRDLREKLFQEMKARIKEDDQSVSKLDNGYYYYYYYRIEKNKQYLVYCRKNRYDYLKDVAFRYAFLIDRMGVDQ